MANKIYGQLQGLTDHYFNSHLFLDDLIDRHLGIKPENLSKFELNKIIDWLVIASYLLANDQKTVKNYLADVNKLMKANG
jgi:hypothetical protein